MYKLDLEKAEESEFKLPTEFQKNIYVCFTDYEAKALDCVDHNKLWKVLQETGILSFRRCGRGHEYAQASEEACLQCPSLWQEEGLVGPQ